MMVTPGPLLWIILLAVCVALSGWRGVAWFLGICSAWCVLFMLWKLMLERRARRRAWAASESAHAGRGGESGPPARLKKWPARSSLEEALEYSFAPADIQFLREWEGCFYIQKRFSFDEALEFALAQGGIMDPPGDGRNAVSVSFQKEYGGRLRSVVFSRQEKNRAHVAFYDATEGAQTSLLKKGSEAIGKPGPGGVAFSGAIAPGPGQLAGMPAGPLFRDAPSPLLEEAMRAKEKSKNRWLPLIIVGWLAAWCVFIPLSILRIVIRELLMIWQLLVMIGKGMAVLVILPFAIVWALLQAGWRKVFRGKTQGGKVEGDEY